MESIKNSVLFSLDETIAKELFLKTDYPWEVLPLIKDFIYETGKSLSKEKYDMIEDGIWIAKSANIHKSAALNGPLIIGENTQVRPSAFIRGSVIVGDNCTVGNSTELKNVILFNNVEVPHYNYVGDAILGFHAHMGAGSITSNIKSDRTNIVIRGDGIEVATGMRKIGAILGDYVEVGCNSVLNPGTIIGAHTNIYPLSMVRGVVPANCILKNKPEFELVRKEEK